jgi:hypothetical protein
MPQPLTVNAIDNITNCLPARSKVRTPLMTLLMEG